MDKDFKKIQIGVMGSMADLKYSKKTERLASQVGFWVARKKAILVFGAEKDADSLSTAACRGAKKIGGLTVGITYGKGLDVYGKHADVVIASGLERGGGRELTLALSCDAIIALGGGSGTLTEIAIAYQANIPVVVLDNTGGWSEKLANVYLDERQRLKIESAKTPKEAVQKAIELAKNSKKMSRNLLFLAGVHGNEKIGVEILTKLEKEGVVTPWITGNERAVEVGQRFIDCDLNRVAPGKASGKKYEVKRAYELIGKISQYEYVIDIHGTVSNSGIFTIVTSPILENLQLAGCLPVQNIVIWPPSRPRQTGPLVSFAKCGVEVECGPKNARNIRLKLKKIVKKVVLAGINLQKSDLASKNIYKVYGKLLKPPAKPLRDFQLTSVLGEQFYPLLVGQYKNIVCYKMKKIDAFNLLFS